uniref:Uncharacterized protein n=1 Tax=Nothoprocta perdicaria TaxID=30464 RepID=A0A8C6YS93_NOTPE
MGPAEHDALAAREQLFHQRVRESLICTLLFISLYLLCHFIITHFKKHTDFAEGRSCWRFAPSRWPCRWALCSCCPSPSSAMRCCSVSPTATTCGGSTAHSSMVGPPCKSSSSCILGGPVLYPALSPHPTQFCLLNAHRLAAT